MKVPSGRGRLDLIITHGGQKVVVETKMWYGQRYLEDGIQQLKRYLRSEDACRGYAVVFDETGVVEDGRVDDLVDGDYRIRVYYIAL